MFEYERAQPTARRPRRASKATSTRVFALVRSNHSRARDLAMTVATEPPADGPRPAASPPALTDEVQTQVDRTISELSAWNRRRRADERAARERLEAPADARDALDAAHDADDDLAALDAELAAAMAAVGVGSHGSLDANTKPSARSGRTVPARVPSVPRRPRPMSAAARRGGTRELARGIGPEIGAGVFGAKDDPAEAEAEAEAEADDAGDEAGGEEDLAFASAVASWTRDVDAVLSRLDACEEVGRAKGAFFEEQGR